MHTTAEVECIADVTTKDLIVDAHVWRDKPCCSRRRSPYALFKNFLGVCFAPVGTRFIHPLNVDRDEFGYQGSRNEDLMLGA